jgi:hypothetical protein
MFDWKSAANTLGDPIEPGFGTNLGFVNVNSGSLLAALETANVIGSESCHTMLEATRG